MGITPEDPEALNILVVAQIKYHEASCGHITGFLHPSSGGSNQVLKSHILILIRF